jgi:hypothetical protein
MLRMLCFTYRCLNLCNVELAVLPHRLTCNSTEKPLPVNSSVADAFYSWMNFFRVFLSFNVATAVDEAVAFVFVLYCSPDCEAW